MSEYADIKFTLCVCVYVCVCMYGRMYVLTYVRMYTYVCVCVCVCKEREREGQVLMCYNFEHFRWSMLHCVRLRVCVSVNCRESSREYLATIFTARVIPGELARSECSDSGELARILRLRSFFLQVRLNFCQF
jgi:hypothetical protein